MQIYLIASLMIFSSFAINASAVAKEDLTRKEKTAACHKVKDLIPTETKMGVSLKTCLSFDFSVVNETSALKTIELLGQTVEDMTTVCTVVLVKDPRIEVAPAKTSCSLE